MSDYDRGPYTPHSERLAFDPRQPVRGGGPAPVTLIVSALVLIAIVGGVFFVYRHGVRHRGAGPAVVGAPLGAIKTPAGPEASNGAPPPQLVIEKTGPDNAAPAFAPPPEEPLPRPTATATATAAPPPKPVAMTKPAAIPAPAPKPAAKPAQTLTIASIVAGAGAAKSPPKPAATPAPAPVAAGSWVQIGAFSSAALADKGWSDVAKLDPDAMKGKGKKVEPVTAGDKSLYRTYITGFASRDAAAAFCGTLKAAGKACFVK
jgi:cell division protein FtsN